MTEQAGGFKNLLNKMMSRRWYITALVLGGFMLIMGGMFAAIFYKFHLQTLYAIIGVIVLMFIRHTYTAIDHSITKEK